MYDFTMTKGRVQEEMNQVAACCKWNPATVRVLEQLLDCYKHIEEIEKMEWDEAQRMKAMQNR